MRDYGKVHATFWSSPTFASSSDDAKVLALYLMTCSHNTIAGVFRMPDGYASEDLGWSPERVQKAFAELFENGFCNRCETTKWAWIVKHLKWNPPANPNQRKAAAKVVLAVPDECGWKREFMRLCGPLLEPGQAQAVGFSETVAEPFRNQEQEQKQEQEQEQERAAPKARRSVHMAKAKRSKTVLSADFHISEGVKAWAEAKGYGDLDQHLEAFLSKCRAKGYTYADWDAAFQGAIRDDWAGLRKAGAIGRRSVMDSDDVFRGAV